MTDTRIQNSQYPAAGPVVPLLAYQRALLESPHRFTWSCWARQTGKSFTLSLRRVLRGILRHQNQLLVSAGMRQSRELMLKVRQHCQVHDIEASSDQARAMYGTTQIRLPSSVRLIALPARPDTIRGFTGDVLLDEFAMHADDRAIWAAIFPTIMRNAGEIDIASTPKGKDNLFYQLSENDLFDKTTLTLPDAIAQGLDLDIDQLRRAMGDEELFRQEFLCEFLDESMAFMPYTLIAACEDESVEKEVNWPALQDSTSDLYAGIDIARKRDLTVIWLWQRLACGRYDASDPRAISASTKHGMGAASGLPAGALSHRAEASWTLRCAGLIEIPGAPFAEQRETIHRILSLRCVRRCCIDATGMGWPLAEWAQEAFGSGRVEAVTFTAGLKAQMASQLRRLAEEHRLRIPAGEQTLRNDWHSVRRTISATGSLRLDANHTESGHADRFWSAALAAHAVETGPTGPAEYTGAHRLRFARQGAW